MKTRTLDLIKQAAAEIVTREGDLPQGQRLTISIDFEPSTQLEKVVVIRTNGASGTHSSAEILTSIFDKMSTGRSRMMDYMTNLGYSMANVMQWDVDSNPPQRGRGVSNGTFRQFAEALIAQGVECRWAHQLLHPAPNTRGGLAHQAQQGKVVRILNTEWEMLLDALLDPPTKHYLVQKELVCSIRSGRNKPFRVASEEQKVGFWGTIVAQINARWYRCELHYRIKSTPAPNTKNKHDVTVQVVHIATKTKE